MAKIDTITLNGGEEMAYDKHTYNLAYKKEHFENIAFYVPKGEREKYRAYAKEHGMSMSELCRQALIEKTGIKPEE